MQPEMTILSAAILLFLIMDPMGNVPFFLSLLKDVPPQRRRWVVARELLIALAVLVGFLLGGKYVLDLMQLKQESVSIGGGIVLFLIGLKMIFPPPDGGIFGKTGGGEPFIVPMAIPGVAGPSAMAALLLMTNNEPGRMLDWGIALFLAWLVTAVVLLSATWLFRVLGESVLTAMERLVGMLLVVLSVQMLLGGIVSFWQHAAM